MTKTLKKTLAIVVALALCLSAFMGCFSVSAADTDTITATVTGSTVTEGAEEVTVTIDIASTGFAAALLDISFGGLDIKADDDGEPAIAVTSTSDAGYDAAAGTWDSKIYYDHNSVANSASNVNVANDADGIRLIVDGTEKEYADAQLVLTFVTPAVGEYTVAISKLEAADYGTYENNAWTDTEAIIETVTINQAEKNVVVGAAHTCDMETKYDEAGHWTECKCGEKTDKVAHKWVDGEVTTEPDCTNAGVQAQSCACGATHDKALDALGHTPVVDEAVAPTCTETGLTEGSHCDVCGAVIVAQEVVEATGHAYGDAIYDLEAGKWYKNCACGDKQETEANVISTSQVGRQLYIGSVFGEYIALPYTTATTGEHLYCGYSDYFIEVISDHYNENYDLYTSEPIYIYKQEVKNSDASADYFLYSGTTGYELGLSITVKVYMRNANGDIVACSVTKSDTLASLALKGLNSELKKPSPNTKLLTLYLDLVNYGAISEEYFGNKKAGSDLSQITVKANAGFESYQDAYATKTAPVAIERNVTDRLGNTGVNLGKQVTIGASNFIAYYVPTMNGYTDENFSLEVSYTDSYNNQHDMSWTWDELLENNRYGFFDVIALYDVDVDVNATLKYNGTPVLTNITTIGHVIAKNTDTTATEILNAVLTVGYAARAYFFN